MNDNSNPELFQNISRKVANIRNNANIAKFAKCCNTNPTKEGPLVLNADILTETYLKSLFNISHAQQGELSRVVNQIQLMGNNIQNIVVNLISLEEDTVHFDLLFLNISKQDSKVKIEGVRVKQDFDIMKNFLKNPKISPKSLLSLINECFNQQLDN